MPWISVNLTRIEGNPLWQVGLRVAVPDMARFDSLYKKLTDAVPIKNVTSHFAMERMTFTTVYPVDTLHR